MTGSRSDGALGGGLEAVHPGELLTARLDGELTTEEAGAVDAHVAGCGACSADVDALARTRTVLRELPPIPAPPGFMSLAVDRRHRADRRGTALAAAAACAAAVLGLAVARPTDTGDDEGPDTLGLSSSSPRMDTTNEPFAAPDGASTLPGVGRDDGGDGGPSIADRIDQAVSGLVEFLGG